MLSKSRRTERTTVAAIAAVASTALFGAIAGSAACSTNQVVVRNSAADGGEAEASVATSCVRQPENVRVSLCDVKTANILLACDPGDAPPHPDCARTVQPDAYCCPAEPGATNPDGVPYPTDNIGWTPRSAGRGDRIPNLALTGYVKNGAVGTIHLADYFDPTRMRYDGIVIYLHAEWAEPSRLGLENLRQAVSADARIASIAVLVEWTVAGEAATDQNFLSWKTNKNWGTFALDADGASFAPSYSGTAIPHVIVVDPRTMEIFRSNAGAPSTQDFALFVSRTREAAPGY